MSSKRLLFLLNVILDVRLVFCCGGIWLENQADWRIEGNVNTITVCDYSNTGVKTPTDVRRETISIKLIGNSIEDGDLDVTILFAQVPELQGINLDNNLLTMIPDMSLFKSTLRSISINANYIANVDFNIFHVFPLLRNIGLGENGLTISDLTANTEEHILPKLFTIDFYDNNISQMKWDIFRFMTNFERIDLSRNNDIELSAPHIHDLTTILLKNCYSSTRVFNFTPFTPTSRLFIQDNHLTGLLGGTGERMDILSTLDARNNLWTTLDLKYLNEIAPNLVTLQMENNLITQVITSKNASILPYLQELTLTDNPLTYFDYFCSPSFDGLPLGLQLGLTGTNLYCGESLLWLATCPYRITYNTHIPLCANPEELIGQSLLDAGTKLLNYGSQKDIVSMEYKNQNKPTTEELLVMVKTQIQPGIIQCARLCLAVQGRSFTYRKLSQSCVVYHDQSGDFLLI